MRLFLTIPLPILFWYYRFKARQFARIVATQHMAMVAEALWTGSTHVYTLVRDVPRIDGSTDIQW